MAPAIYRVPSPGGVTPGVRGGVRYGPRHPSRVRPPLGSAAQPAQPGSGVPTPPWSPPPLPSGSYDPTRDVNVEQSQEGLGQLEGKIGTGRARTLADYLTQRSQLEEQGGRNTADFNRNQQLLQQSYQRLKGRQEEGANAAGLLGGGALLQAAQKRAANEGQQSEQQKTAYGRQQEGVQRALASLNREEAPPDEANPLGGRHWQDMLTELTNAQTGGVNFARHEHELAGSEAARSGYTPPPIPASELQRRQRAREAAGGVQRRTYGSPAWVRVGGR